MEFIQNPAEELRISEILWNLSADQFLRRKSFQTLQFLINFRQTVGQVNPGFLKNLHCRQPSLLLFTTTANLPCCPTQSFAFHKKLHCWQQFVGNLVN